MDPIKVTAHRAGALYFVFLLVGLFDMFGFTGFLVPGDATATARNILADQLWYRVGIMTDFAALLVFCALVVSLYRLFKGVDRWHAMLMVLLVSVGIAIGLANLFNKIAPLILLSGADYLSVFTRPQLEALALGLLNLNRDGNTVDEIFWGLWLLPFGVLVIRSGFLPRVLGILLLVAGGAYVTSSVTSLVLPAYSHVVSQATMPLLLGEFPIIFWLLIKGARVPQPRMESSPVLPVVLSFCLITLLAARPAFGQTAEREFASRSCHVAFRYPGGWEVVADTADRTMACSFLLRPRNWEQRLVRSDSVDVFTVLVRVVRQDVWRHATNSGFERRPGGWVVLGRQGVAAPADSIGGSGWRGVRGTAQAGCYREGGSYAGVCDSPMAVLGTSTRSVLLVAGPQAEDVFNRLVATLRLD